MRCVVFDPTKTVRALRIEQGLKLSQLAADAGLSVQELMKIERGLVGLRDEVASKLAVCLRADPVSLRTAQVLLVQAPAAGEGYTTSRAENGTLIRRRAGIPSNRRPIVDLFCGVGGFSFGFEMTDEFIVVAGVDLLSDRLKTFSRNHPCANLHGQDIRALNVDDILQDSPPPFAIVGGPPCQGFSSIRPFRNIDHNDPRNNLAEEFFRVVGELRPEWVVFENVVGLLTHRRGETLKTILDAFKSLGYRTEARVLNAAYYGLPQRRERLVVVGSKRGKAFKWPDPTHYCEHRSMAGDLDLVIRPPTGLFACDLKQAVSVDEAIGDLPPVPAGGRALTYDDEAPAGDYSKFIRNGAECLTQHEATAHSDRMLEIIRLAGSNINALPPGLVKSGFSSCYSRLDGDQPSVTMTVNFVHPASNRCIHPYQDRALTVREGARLQGFFDTFIFDGTRSQVVKQIGNAVPPLLGRVIARAILECD